MASDPTLRDDCPACGPWVLTLRNPDDPHGHHVRAEQRDATTSWDVQYFRGDTLVDEGVIGTPPPHAPPVATLMETLRELRTEADYWTRHG